MRTCRPRTHPDALRAAQGVPGARAVSDLRGRAAGDHNADLPPKDSPGRIACRAGRARRPCCARSAWPSRRNAPYGPAAQGLTRTHCVPRRACQAPVLCPICAAKPQEPCALCQGRLSQLRAAAEAEAAAEARGEGVGSNSGEQEGAEGAGGGGGSGDGPTEWCCRRAAPAGVRVLVVTWLLCRLSVIVQVWTAVHPPCRGLHRFISGRSKPKEEEAELLACSAAPAHCLALCAYPECVAWRAARTRTCGCCGRRRWRAESLIPKP